MKLSLNRSGLILLVAVAVGGSAAFGVNRYIRLQVRDIEERGKGKATVRVLVPKQDMSIGAVLTADAIALRNVPAEWAHSNAIGPDQVSRVVNHKLAYRVSAGEPILWALLEGERAPSFSSRLAVGHRAITVPVDEVNSISGMIEPGDRIDLMAWLRRDSKTFMFPLLQNVQILATGSRTVVEPDAKDGRRTYTTITLDATPEEAQRVLAAREVGKIAALLRAPGDSAKSLNPKKDALAVLGISDERPPEKSGEIQVLYGGRAMQKSQPMPVTSARSSAPSTGAEASSN